MVLLGKSLWAGRKIRNFLRAGFMDSLRVHVVGGNGGSGLPRYGGQGGLGGSVACIGVQGASLASIRRQYPEKAIRAGHGVNSIHKMILGPPGQDVILEVPVGLTLIHNSTSLGEINEVGEQIIVARGGEGGGPKNGWMGQIGEARSLELELRLIADVGLLGFPNAGKSTLLRAVSRAKPKVASYPFTTVRPHIGTLEYDDLRQITMADLPGLVEGAHLNIGMGHKFLRHVERTKLLLMLVDINGFSLSAHHKHRSCLENILLLNKELEMYNPELLSKPTILVVNKMDTPDADKNFANLKEMLENLENFRDTIPASMWPKELISFEDIATISAKESQHVLELKNRVRLVLDILADREAEEAAALVSGEQLVEELHSKLRERGPTLT